MESIIKYIGVIGGIASIIGAIISVVQSKKAKSSAQIAENAKSNLLNRQNTSDLSILFNQAKRIQKNFTKYKLALVNRPLDGVNFDNDSNEFQEFILEFNEKKSVLELIGSFKFIAYHTKMNKLLDEFTEANDIDEKRSIGKNIVSSLNIIISSLNEEINKKNKNN